MDLIYLPLESEDRTGQGLNVEASTSQHGLLAQRHKRLVDLVVATLGLLLGEQIEFHIVGMHGQPGLGGTRET